MNEMHVQEGTPDDVWNVSAALERFNVLLDAVAKRPAAGDRA